MRKFVKLLVFIALLLFSKSEVHAQLSVSTNVQIDSLKVDKEIPTLDTFIQSALKNSVLLKLSEIEFQDVLEKIKTDKKSWSDNLFIEGNARYGRYNQILVNQEITSGVDYGVKSANEQFTYFAGVTLKLPISYLLNRKSQSKILKNDLNSIKLKKEQFENEITNIVIDEYYKLIKSYQIVQINQNVLQLLNISYLKAEKDIENGLIEFNDLANILISKGKAEEGYYNAKNDYYALYRKIQVLTGLNLNTSK
jgi:outer membrane protein TolC